MPPVGFETKISAGERPAAARLLCVHNKKHSVMSNYLHMYSEEHVHLRIWLAETNLKNRAAITSETMVPT